LHLSLTFSKLLVHHPCFSHRSPPCSFFGSFFCKCILQAAIDFAVLLILARQGVAGFALRLTFSRLLDAKPPRSTSQPTVQIFKHLQFAKVQLILRSCGCGVGAAEQMVERERNAARFIRAYLSKFRGGLVIAFSTKNFTSL